MTDLAKRAHDHSYGLDPIVRSLLDTDFYKLLMLQFVWRRHAGVRATFRLTNRTTRVRIADEVDEARLREQLDHARTLRFARKELVWLQGNTFFGVDRIFDPGFVAWLADFSLPDYALEKVDGQYDLTFSGTWAEASMWEIPALSIVNELRARAAMRRMGRFDLDLLYARAKARLWDKVERLRVLRSEGPLKVGDFGTRRRHGYLWQRWCCEALASGIGDSFVGTSNVHVAMETDLEAVGTNAHELPMAYAAMAKDDRSLKDSRYRVLEDWAEEYDGRLLVLLPDAYGTTSFLRDAPDWTASWRGARPDSKPPLEGGDEFVSWWRARGEDPRDKLLVLSDGMDIRSIEASVRHFRGRVGVSVGWGTNLTNDFEGCGPDGASGLGPVSLVCKLDAVDGRPAVKLSDNPSKATGPRAEVERYLGVFGTEGMASSPVRT